MYWGKNQTSIAILGSLGILILHLILFPNYIMALPILMMGIGIILFFYIAFNYYTNNWISTLNFTTKLFSHSLVYRLFSLIGMHYLTLLYEPQSLPLEIGAADSWNYLLSGELVAETLKNGGNIFHALSYYWKSESDYGFSIFIGLLFSVFGNNLLIILIFNAILSSLTAVKVYKITSMLYNEHTARIAGILMMLMPSFLWFTGMLLKETLLIFILVSICKIVLDLTLNRNSQKIQIFLLLIYIGLLFYFRVFLAPLVIISAVLHISFYSKRKLRYRLFTIFFGIVLAFGSYLLITKLRMGDSIMEIITSSQGQFSNELSSSAEQRGVNYKVLLVAPFIIMGSIITPLPSLLHFDNGQIGIYAHFQNEIIRNFLYFFVFIGLYNFVKNKNRNALYVFLFAIGYITVLAVSGTSFQDRFQLISLPFLIIFMADGITTKIHNKDKKWKTYLFVIFMVIISWNLFKLIIRDIL